MQEMQVPSLGRENPLEEGLATHRSILAWKIPQREKRSLEGYSPWGRKESDTTLQLRNNSSKQSAHSEPKLVTEPTCFPVSSCFSAQV